MKFSWHFWLKIASKEILHLIFFRQWWWTYVIKKSLYFSEVAHRMEERIQISDVSINASGNCMRLCGCEVQGLIFTRRLCLFLWQLPDGHCRKRWPTWIFTKMSTSHCGQKANTMSFYRCSIIKNNILCRSLYNNQNTKGTAHSIWEKHKNRVCFVKCQRWFHLDGVGYIKAVCFVDRCTFYVV